MLPSAQWPAYDDLLRALGRRDRPSADSRSRLPDFLAALGLVDETGALTSAGNAYFEKAFVLGDVDQARDVIQAALLRHPAVELLCQVFHGRGQVGRNQLDSLFHSQDMRASRAELGRLLDILNKFRVVRYSRKTNSFLVLIPVSPLAAPTPKQVFLSPETPFSNVQRVRELLMRASGCLTWLDKHFDRKALPLIADTADGRRLTAITIVSGPHNVDAAAKTELRLLSKELAAKGVELKWLVVDADQLRDVHDRWIVCDEWAFNVPPVNSLFGGQAAEVAASPSPDEVRSFANKVAARGRSAI